MGGVITTQDTSNQDFYAVLSKTIAKMPLPSVLNFGYKATNASLLGLVGNTPAYKARAFGAAAFVLRGPWRSTVMLGSGFLQEPRTVQDVPGAVVPTTITYAVRIVPAGAFPAAHGWGEERPRLNIDLGIAQAANNVLPGVSLQARRQFCHGNLVRFLESTARQRFLLGERRESPARARPCSARNRCCGTFRA